MSNSAIMDILRGTGTDHRPAPPTPGAMTLIEMIICVFLLGVILFLAAGWMQTLKNDARRELAVRELSLLDKALMKYYRAEGVYPNAPGPNAAHWATVALLDHERTRPILESLPPSLLRGASRNELVDPWGKPLKYESQDSGSPFVRANNGRPLFISAGPDGGFGDDDPAQLGDNMRSDDPGPDGFPLHDALRESLTEAEQANGQKDD